jgi:hypothetical protein
VINERHAPHRGDWLWPVGILLSVLALAASMALDVEGPVRPVLSIWFFVVCPGAAWVRLMGVGGGAVRWTIAIAASLSFEVLVALGMVYTGWWSVGGGFAIVAAVAVVGALTELAVRRTQVAREDGRP